MVSTSNLGLDYFANYNCGFTRDRMGSRREILSTEEYCHHSPKIKSMCYKPKDLLYIIPEYSVGSDALNLTSTVRCNVASVEKLCPVKFLDSNTFLWYESWRKVRKDVTV